MSSTVPENTPEVAIVGEWARIRGSFTSNGTLIVEGILNGSVRCPRLVVMEKGEVTGFIQVGDAEVWGTVGGFARAGKMVCRRTARLLGCVMVQSVALEPGVVVEGTIVFTKPEGDDDEGKEGRERESRLLEEEPSSGN
ncbi:MAG: polymer-forming cytoskeletal protein [Candidatus Caldatribacterium sp.]|nr:polymer-forming cytoskeletal protein [Candidatus Caldatribacterium sp.]